MVGNGPLRAVGLRLRLVLWRVVVSAVAAATAWWIAQRLLGERAPIFAPIAAMVSLLDEPGTRGDRALRLLGGVLAGVAVGEVLVRFLGGQPQAVGLAMGIAALLVAVVSVNPLVMIQAGVGALLVVALHEPETGPNRLWGALIGAALALTISQVLWSPSPVWLLSAAARTTLAPVSHSLRSCARALADMDPGIAREALETARTGYHGFGEFESARTSSRSIVNRTVRGRRQRRGLERLATRTARFEHLHTDTLLLSRSVELVVREGLHAPAEVVEAVRDLARAVDLLAEDPTSEWRQRRAHELLAPARDLSDSATAPAHLVILTTEVRQVAFELELVAGS